MTIIPSPEFALVAAGFVAVILMLEVIRRWL